MPRLTFITLCDLAGIPQYEHIPATLAAAGWHVHIIGPNAGRSAWQSVLPYECRVTDIWPQGGSKLRAGRQISTELLLARLNSSDVIIVQSQALAVWAALSLLGPVPRKRVVFHNTELYDPLRFRVRSWLQNRMRRKADLCIDSEYHRAYIARTVARAKSPFLVVPPNLPARWPIPLKDEAIRHLVTGGDPDAFVLVQHGGYAPKRMSEELLVALSRLPRRFRLVMTNSDTNRSVLSAQLRKSDLSDRVTLLPGLDFCEMLRYTVNCDAGVLLYRNNDLGNFFTSPGRLTEYLACGLPVIASHHTGLQSLVLQFQLGMTVDASHPEEIGAGLLKFERLARANANSGCLQIRQKFVDYFSYEQWEPQVRECFAQLLVGRRVHISESAPPATWWHGSAYYPWS